MMLIEDHLLAISKCMFQERNKWEYVTDEQKEKWFFIINRTMSKKYPELSQLLNQKTIDKVASMDLWFHFMEGKPYPKWFWSKTEKKNNINNKLTDSEISMLLKEFQIREEELNILLEYHHDEVLETLKYLKDLEKGNK